MYSAGEVEILAVGKELADCGTTPSVALEYAALIVSKAETVLAEYMARKIAAAKSAEAISDDLEKFMPLLVASIRMNPKRGRADFVQILTRDTFSIDNMFPDRKPTIMVPIGIIKIALAAMLSKIELSRPAKQGRTAATDKRAKKAKR
jgi:hypothetical protein